MVVLPTHDAARRSLGLKAGRTIGVRGTPTFFVTVGEPGTSKVRVLRRIYGAYGWDKFKQVVDEVLGRLDSGM